MKYSIEESQIVIDKVYSCMQECCKGYKTLDIKDYIPANKLRYVFLTEMVTKKQMESRTIFYGKTKNLLQNICNEISIPITQIGLFLSSKKMECRNKCYKDYLSNVVDILEPRRIINIDGKTKENIIIELLKGEN